MKKQPKSVFIVRSNPMAPDPRTKKEAITLSKNGFSVKVIAWDKEGNLKQFESEKFGKVYRIRTKILSNKNIKIKHFKGLINIALWNFSLLKFFVKHRNEYAVIHVLDFDSIIPAYLCKVFLHKKVIYDVADFYSDMLVNVSPTLRKILRFIDLFIINRVDAVILPDEQRAKWIEGANPKSLTFIYNSVPGEILQYAENSADLGSVEHKITYIGLLAFERGLLPIINVVKKLSNWRLILGGFGGNEPEIRKICKDVKNIEVLGKMSYEEVIRLESVSDILFATYDPSIPNHRFSSPNKLFEAMAFGKPIIVARGTGVDKIVEKYNLGFVVDYGNEQQLEKVLKEVETWDKEKKKQFAEHSIKIYNENFSWEIMEKRLVDLYSNLLDSGDD